MSDEYSWRDLNSTLRKKLEDWGIGDGKWSGLSEEIQAIIVDEFDGDPRMNLPWELLDTEFQRVLEEQGTNENSWETITGRAREGMLKQWLSKPESFRRGKPSAGAAPTFRGGQRNSVGSGSSPKVSWHQSARNAVGEALESGNFKQIPRLAKWVGAIFAVVVVLAMAAYILFSSRTTRPVDQPTWQPYTPTATVKVSNGGLGGGALATDTPIESTITPTVTKKATSTKRPVAQVKPTPGPITDNSVTAAETLGSHEWVLILGSIVLTLLAAGEAFGRINSAKRGVGERGAGRDRGGVVITQDILSYLDIFAPIVGFISVVFVSDNAGTSGWWILVAIGVCVSVFSGGFDLSPLWTFLSTVGAGYFLKGSAGLYANMPWLAKMKEGSLNLGETISVINTKTMPLAAVFHLVMLTAAVGLAVEVIRESRNKAIVIVGFAWPVLFWGLRALELTAVEEIKGFSLPLPAFLISGLIHVALSSVVVGRIEGDTGRSMYGVPARLDFILMGCILALWSFVAFVP